MTWKQDNNLPFLTFESVATTANELKADLELVLERLNKEEIISNRQILLFIDATNGHIFISEYDRRADEAFDEKGIWIELENLWQENDNAYDFDDIVVKAIKKALNSPIGTMTKDKFEVYYQTEEDDLKEIK
ncbi:hypothetical protein [Terrimonas alba]|uniref:hypothetical protein n=1 Tax=Terrimonas alba TaxID=3349636 RepID=UPI0035F4C4AF